MQIQGLELTNPPLADSKDDSSLKNAAFTTLGGKHCLHICYFIAVCAFRISSISKLASAF